jgi:hypothetical protein
VLEVNGMNQASTFGAHLPPMFNYLIQFWSALHSLYEDARKVMRDASAKFLDRGLKVAPEDRALLNVRTAEWLSMSDGHLYVQC